MAGYGTQSNSHRPRFSLFFSFSFLSALLSLSPLSCGSLFPRVLEQGWIPRRSRASACPGASASRTMTWQRCARRRRGQQRWCPPPRLFFPLLQLTSCAFVNGTTDTPFIGSTIINHMLVEQRAPCLHLSRSAHCQPQPISSQSGPSLHRPLRPMRHNTSAKCALHTSPASLERTNIVEIPSCPCPASAISPFAPHSPRQALAGKRAIAWTTTICTSTSPGRP